MATNRTYGLMTLVGRFRDLEYFNSDPHTKQRLLAKLQKYLPLDVREEFFRQQFCSSRELADFVERLAEQPDGKPITEIIGYLCGFPQPATRDDVFEAIHNWFAAKGRIEDFDDALTLAITRIKAEIAFEQSPVDTTQPN